MRIDYFVYYTTIGWNNNAAFGIITYAERNRTMICEKCGTVLPDDATFCGECGAKIEPKKKKPAALLKAKADAKRFKIISIILAAFCVILGFGWLHAAHDPYNSIDNYENDVSKIERAGIEMSGTYVVGEDSELPEGRYNIYPPDDASYMSVSIYDNMEDAKKEYDEDYHSLALENLYSLSRGYKLKAGQVVVINYDSAYFELVSEPPTETTESETITEAETTEATPETVTEATEQ